MKKIDFSSTFLLDALREEELIQIATQWSEHATKGSVVALSGNVGAGKSVWIRAAIRYLFGQEDRVISSPTFGFVHTYQKKVHPTVHHFDLYRLPSEQKFLTLGFQEYFSSQAIVFIEWADRIASLLPLETELFILWHQNAHHRKLSYSPSLPAKWIDDPMLYNPAD